MGMMAVTNKTVNANIQVSTASMMGFNLATKLATVSLEGWLTIATGGIYGLLALTSILGGVTVSMDEITAANEKGADGFIKVDKAISGAQLSLAAYNSAMKEYNNDQVTIQRLNAANKIHERKGTSASWSEFFDFMGSMKNRNEAAPNKADFFDNPADTATAGAPIPKQASNSNDSLEYYLKQIAYNTGNNPKGRMGNSVTRKQTGSFG